MKEDVPITIAKHLQSAYSTHKNSEKSIAVKCFIKDRNLDAKINLIGSQDKGNCSKSHNMSKANF